MSADQIESLALPHLRCGYPGQDCEPIEAAIAAGLGDRETIALTRAIDGYHHPLARLLIARAAAATPEEER